MRDSCVLSEQLVYKPAPNFGEAWQGQSAETETLPAAEVAESIVPVVVNYRQQLPAGCPPNDGTCLMIEEIALRLTVADPPAQWDFDSHKARGQRSGKTCALCSCSMFRDTHASRQRLIDMANLPNFKHAQAYIASVRINEDAGMVKINSVTGHIDLWFYRDFDPISATERSERIK